MFTNHYTKDIYEKKVENVGERERENITKTRNSRSQMFVKIGAFKNFAIFIRKHLCWTLTQMVSSEYWEVLRTAFFTEHIWWLLL